VYDAIRIEYVVAEVVDGESKKDKDVLTCKSAEDECTCENDCCKIPEPEPRFVEFLKIVKTFALLAVPAPALTLAIIKILLLAEDGVIETSILLFTKLVELVLKGVFSSLDTT